VICPGTIDTPMARANAKAWNPEDPDSVIDEWRAKHALKRIASRPSAGPRRLDQRADHGDRREQRPGAHRRPAPSSRRWPIGRRSVNHRRALAAMGCDPMG
jgi:hypothetical protein